MSGKDWEVWEDEDGTHAVFGLITYDLKSQDSREQQESNTYQMVCGSPTEPERIEERNVRTEEKVTNKLWESNRQNRVAKKRRPKLAT